MVGGMRGLRAWWNPWGILSATVVASAGAGWAAGSVPGVPAWQCWVLGAPGAAAILRLVLLLLRLRQRA